MKRCPKCGGKRFIVTAHVAQDWLVDEFGEYLRTIEDCVEVTHRPDNEDIFGCFDCGYYAPGKEFEI